MNIPHGSGADNYKKQAIMVTLPIMLVVLLFIILMIFPWKKEEVKSESTSTSSSVETESANSEIKAGKEPVYDGFVLLESKEPTLQTNDGISGTEEWKENEQIAKQYCTEENKLPNETSAIGNPLYLVPISAIPGDLSGDAAGRTRVQLSGVNMISPYGTSQYVTPREEWTGKRIYMVNFKEQKEEFEENWAKGEKILNEEIEAEEGTLLVNGRVIPGYQFETRNKDEIYIPLLPIVEAMDFSSEHPDTSEILLPRSLPAGETKVRVPMSFVSSNTFSALINEETFEFGEFHAGDGYYGFVPASELSRYTGWQIYFNGKAVHVVTDPLDVSNLVKVKITGATDLPAREQLANNGVIVHYTDPSELIDSTPEAADSTEDAKDAESSEVSDDISATETENKTDSESTPETESEAEN